MRLVARTIIDLAERGFRDAYSLLEMTLRVSGTNAHDCEADSRLLRGAIGAEGRRGGKIEVAAPPAFPVHDFPFKPSGVTNFLPCEVAC
jgi:hypothetical protein